MMVSVDPSLLRDLQLGLSCFRLAEAHTDRTFPASLQNIIPKQNPARNTPAECWKFNFHHLADKPSKALALPSLGMDHLFLKIQGN
jgi:hypothetical protein